MSSFRRGSGLTPCKVECFRVWDLRLQPMEGRVHIQSSGLGVGLTPYLHLSYEGDAQLHNQEVCRVLRVMQELLIDSDTSQA